LLFGISERATAQTEPKLNLVHPLPPRAPAWLDGYRVRWPIRAMGELDKQPAKSIVVRIPGGGWLKPDASDLALEAPTGKLLPHLVLSHDPLGDTIVQFQRDRDEPWYWVYGVGGPGGPKADAKTMAEGITLEVRDFAGRDLSSWPKVREVLDKTPAIIGNAVVTEVVQNCCPARPEQSSKFAASYRGNLTIEKAGTYSFLVNADDAAFLFIDGFKVYEQPGGSTVKGTINVKVLDKIAGKVELKPGVHPFEVHHAVGDVPTSPGRCSLIWKGPDMAKVAYVPPTAFVQPVFARVAAMESRDGETAGLFTHGLDDTIDSPGIRLFLVRFEAQGPGKSDAFHWNFGDGTTGTGRSVTHVYFNESDYLVSLAVDGSPLPPCKRRIHVWAEPTGETSPLSLEKAVDALATMDWQKLDGERLRSIFSFLQACNQSNRWPFVDRLAAHLLAQKDGDLEQRSQFYLARLEALTQLGKAGEALKLGEEALKEFTRTPALTVRLQLGVAAIHQYHFKDAGAASRIYKDILDKHSRTEHPNLRLAAIRWGDLFAEAGDLAKADETYRVAATLGGEKFQGASVTDAATRGALLRIAEQKLRAGEIHATRQLLDRVEMEYPGRRLDGLYCFLKAESDRAGGRYEDSQRNYEMIFRLPQWAGYRDRATFGIADCYLRMGELDKAQKWFADLKETYPAFVQAQKLDETIKLLAERIERSKSANGDKEAVAFKEFATSFEPTETSWFGDTKEFAIVRAPSIGGGYSALFDVWPQTHHQYNYEQWFKNLTPGGTYWVEFWTQDLARHSAYTVGVTLPWVQVYLFDEPKKLSTLITIHPQRNSHHGWHKYGVKIKMPAAADGSLKLIFGNANGFTLVDRVSIRAVSDRAIDSLLLFQQGAQTP
jgi:tetratricopeptide (TPR) repeat protein